MDEQLEQADKALHGVADHNVEQLKRVDKALRGMLPAQREMHRQRQEPGSRPDGGIRAAKTHKSIIKELVDQVLQHEAILQNKLADATRLVDEFEEQQIRLEDEVLQLKATLQEERNQCALFQNRCEELKNVLRSAAEIMVNGEKARA